jgi:uncharacterized membrane protein
MDNELDNNIMQADAAKSLATLVYALQAASFLVGITFIIAVVVNYLKQDEVRGTIAQSHFRWQIRTFWFGLLWSFVGAVLALVLVGYLILFANAIWIIYRILKGWLALNENKDIYTG